MTFHAEQSDTVPYVDKIFFVCHGEFVMGKTNQWYPLTETWQTTIDVLTTEENLKKKRRKKKKKKREKYLNPEQVFSCSSWKFPENTI